MGLPRKIRNLNIKHSLGITKIASGGGQKSVVARFSHEEGSERYCHEERRKLSSGAKSALKKNTGIYDDAKHLYANRGEKMRREDKPLKKIIPLRE